MTGSWRIDMICSHGIRIATDASGEATYLGIVLDPLHGLLLGLTSTGAELGLQTLLLLLFELAGVFPVVVLLGLGADIQGSVVFFHRHQGLGLTQVRTDELGVAGNRLVAVLHGLRESHQLDEGSSAVGESSGIGGCPLGHLRESIDSSGPVALLELLLPEFTRVLGGGRVNVGLLLCLVLGLFGVAELRQSVGSTVFGERLVVELDGLGEITFLLVRSADSRESPS